MAKRKPLTGSAMKGLIRLLAAETVNHTQASATNAHYDKMYYDRIFPPFFLFGTVLLGISVCAICPLLNTGHGSFLVNNFWISKGLCLGNCCEFRWNLHYIFGRYIFWHYFLNMAYCYERIKWSSRYRSYLTIFSLLFRGSSTFLSCTQRKRRCRVLFQVLSVRVRVYVCSHNNWKLLIRKWRNLVVIYVTVPL